jgi:hypothetical protein
MTNIFDVPNYEFPYSYKFPGQASDEQILFVTRENPVMLVYRLTTLIVVAVIVLLSGVWASGLLNSLLNVSLPPIIPVVAGIFAVLIALVGWWWNTVLWKKSLGIVTTKRLVKFIFTTPFNRHSLSLPLEMIVDTGAYSKGFLQALFKLETFTARSSASSSGVATDDNERVNKKYFYLENIAIAEDLQHYVNKLLDAFRHKRDQLDTFRPFIPKLKGDARKQFMERYPEYWS